MKVNIYPIQKRSILHYGKSYFVAELAIQEPGGFNWTKSNIKLDNKFQDLFLTASFVKCVKAHHKQHLIALEHTLCLEAFHLDKQDRHINGPILRARIIFTAIQQAALSWFKSLYS